MTKKEHCAIVVIACWGTALLFATAQLVAWLFGWAG
jgi:hypothetical protein